MKMGAGSPKRIENAVGKGEIAQFEQFLPFPQSFQKTCMAYTYKPGIVWERLMRFSHYFGYIMATSACTNPFPKFLSTRTQYNILPKPLAAFRHNFCKADFTPKT